MDLAELDIHALCLLFRQVYIPLMNNAAVKRGNKQWITAVKDFEELLTHFDALATEPKDDKQNQLTTGKKSHGAQVNKTFPTSFSSMRDEYVFWQTQIIQLSYQKRWMLQQWGEVTTEMDATLRQVHYTLKLFRLVRDPIEVFSSERSIDRVDLYVKALTGAIKAVVLQPTAKSGVHSKFVELISNNTNLLARWSHHVLRPKNLCKAEAEMVASALNVWEVQWADSKLDAVGKLTSQEFSDMFLGTRTVLDSVRTVQSLVREIEALTAMVGQISDYFARQRLTALIQETLQKRIDGLEMRLFLIERRADFLEFVHDHQAAQKAVEEDIQNTIKSVLDEHSSFEGLKLLRKIIDASNALAGKHSGSLDEFLARNQRDQLNRLSTELRLIRKGFDVTDYLNEKDAGNVDMAQRLFERRLLYHRVKVSLLFIFPRPTNWDETPASIKIKEQYVELAKYLKTTEDKLHHKWFATVQSRASKVMNKPILKKLPKGGFVTTLQDTLMTIWDETRLFLQTRFQVPHVCHVLLMQKPDLVHHNRALIAILEKLSAIVEKLTPFEFAVLSNHYSSVENALNLGLRQVTWPSLCLASYIQELLESVERFQAVSEDVKLITKLLDDRIDKIMDHRLLVDNPTAPSSSTVGSRKDPKVPDEKKHATAAQFFESLSQKGDEFFIDIRRIVSDLPPILLQVESLVSNSQTGSSPEMQNYYDYWREKIFGTVLKSLQERFNELSDLLSGKIFSASATRHVFDIQVSLDEEGRLVVEPDLESIEREISQIVHYWMKRSAVVPNWQEGTCIPLPTVLPGQQSPVPSNQPRSFYDRLAQEPLLRVTVERNQEHCKRLVSKLQAVIDRWTACTELWCTDKEVACKELQDTSPALWQYDEQLQHYRNHWSARIAAIDDQATVCCVSLQMQQLKRKAEEHIVEWIRLLGATWLQNTRENLVQLEALLGSRNEASSTEGGTLSRDGSIDIDIEMLLIGVRESWHRLGHYGIQVPDDMKTKLEDISTRFCSA